MKIGNDNVVCSKFQRCGCRLEVALHDLDVATNLELGLEFLHNGTSLKISRRSPSYIKVKWFGICNWEWARAP